MASEQFADSNFRFGRVSLIQQILLLVQTCPRLSTLFHTPQFSTLFYNPHLSTHVLTCPRLSTVVHSCPHLSTLLTCQRLSTFVHTFTHLSTLLTFPHLSTLVHTCPHSRIVQTCPHSTLVHTYQQLSTLVQTCPHLYTLVHTPHLSTFATSTTCVLGKTQGTFLAKTNSDFLPQSPFMTIYTGGGGFFILFIFSQKPLKGLTISPFFLGQQKQKYWCYYPHRSRYLVSLVCGILK